MPHDQQPLHLTACVSEGLPQGLWLALRTDRQKKHHPQAPYGEGNGDTERLFMLMKLVWV